MLAIPCDLVDGLETSFGRASLSRTIDRAQMLLAAFAVLLYRYSGEHEVSIGIAPSPGIFPIAGSDAETFDMIFQSHISLAGDPTLRALADRIARQYGDAFGTRADRPIDSPLSPAARSRLKNVTGIQFEFGFSSAAMAAEYRGAETPTKFGPQLVPRSGNELAMWATWTNSQLDCTLEYNIELFDASTARRMLGHLEVLLRGAAANPLEAISTLALLTEAERHVLLEEWNQPATAPLRPEPPLRYIHQMFADQASSTPDAVAIDFEGQRLTYRELDERSNQFANALRSRRAGPNLFVGICLDRSPELVIGLLGILKAGAAFVPLEPSYPAPRLLALMAETGVAILVTSSRLLAKFPPGPTIVICVDIESASIASESPACPEVPLTEESIAAVMFSSGSTGAPKAIPRPHRLFRLGS